MTFKMLAPVLGLGAAALLFAACSDDPTGPQPPQGRAVFGVDNANNLRQFGTENPGDQGREVAITGTASGETIVGIDFNAVSGQLFGVGSTANIYVIDTVSGAATLVGAGPFGSLAGNTRFGIDFNPVPDRFRVHGDAGLNLRLNQTTGILAGTDTVLAYAAADANAGATPNIVGTAYTNSVVGATTTVLFAIDSDLDVLVTVPMPNSGQLTTVGALGVNTDEYVGFDITGDDGMAYAALRTGTGSSSLYTITLATGRVTLAGTIRGDALVGIAVVP